MTGSWADKAIDDMKASHEAELSTLLDRVSKLEKALEPFSAIAGEMFSRNWNAKQIVAALDNPDRSFRVRAGDFFDARAALDQDKGGGNE